MPRPPATNSPSSLFPTLRSTPEHILKYFRICSGVDLSVGKSDDGEFVAGGLGIGPYRKYRKSEQQGGDSEPGPEAHKCHDNGHAGSCAIRELHQKR